MNNMHVEFDCFMDKNGKNDYKIISKVLSKY